MMDSDFPENLEVDCNGHCKLSVVPPDFTHYSTTQRIQSARLMSEEEYSINLNR
jgi:hypothetical protein